MMTHPLQGGLRTSATIVLAFSLALALAGCGSSGTVVCNAASGSSCPGSEPGPEVLYGFAVLPQLEMERAFVR